MSTALPEHPKPVFYICRTCAEVYTAPVWHCPECGSHYPDDECGNCYHRRTPDDLPAIPVKEVHRDG